MSEHTELNIKSIVIQGDKEDEWYALLPWQYALLINFIKTSPQRNTMSNEITKNYIINGNNVILKYVAYYSKLGLYYIINKTTGKIRQILMLPKHNGSKTIQKEQLDDLNKYFESTQRGGNINSETSENGFNVVVDPYLRYTGVEFSTTSPILFSEKIDYKKDYLPSLRIDTNEFDNKTLNISYYQNINVDYKVQDRVVNYFYYKLLDKYLYEDLIDILNYFIIQNGEVKLISKLSDYKSDNYEKDTSKDIEKKVDYIGEHIFTKKMMREILSMIVNENVISWVDLHKHSQIIKELVRKKIKNNIKHKLSN